MTTSAPDLVWRAAGRPTPPQPMEAAEGRCVTCGTPIMEGVPVRRIAGAAFNNHAEYLRFGRWACPACAWLYSQVHGKPGNILAVGETLYRPLISEEAAAEQGRPSWRQVLLSLQRLPPETPVAGVLTTDVKPRLWPRMPLASIGAFALYVHATEYDLSTVVPFSLQRFEQVLHVIESARLMGWSKSRIASSLWLDGRSSRVDLLTTYRMECELQRWRSDPAFLPALIVAGTGG